MGTASRSIAALCAAALALGLGSYPANAQVDEAQLEAQLEQLGRMLGLPPVGPEELKARVIEIGGLSFEDEVPIDFMTRDELASYLETLFAEEYPVDFAEREERALRAFGLLDADDDLRSIRERVLYENIAGFYDERPGVKKLFAISATRELGLMNQLVLSHEIRHAIQDQHVAIRDKLSVESDYDDRRLAALCLFEGDAVLVMQQYLSAGGGDNPLAQNLSQAFAQALSGPELAQLFAGSALAGAPAVVQEQLVAPYFRGARLAQAAYERGGFALLNELLENPPRSTEQVLHPEKYLGSPSDEPVPVALPEAEGLEVDFEGRLGELLTRTLLASGPAASSAEAAAAGWGGDAYAIVKDSGSMTERLVAWVEGTGRYRLLWRSVWDTESDAAEFEAALRSHMSALLGGDGYALAREGVEVFFERRFAG